MIKKVLVAVFIVSINICSINATVKINDAHITGHVIDAETGEHIPYAKISIEGTNIVVQSDGTGHFLITNVPVGNIVLIASLTGYHTSELEVLIEGHKTTEVKFELKPKVLEIDSIVVTGSRNETNKRESSAIVNVVSSRIFETTSSATVAEALNYQPGLRVEQTCGNCGVPQLRINGLEGQYTQMLLDSRPMFSSLASVYGLEQLPAGMIERVEVLRGGGSALFGSSAVAGVVNIITKEPTRNTMTIANETGVFGRGGTEVNTTLNVALVSDDRKAGAYVFGMVKDKSPYDRNDDGFSESPQLESETVGFRSFYRLTNNSKITAEYHHMREYRRGGDNLDLPPHEADIAEQLRHNINGGGLKYDYFTPDNKNRVSIYSSLQYIDRDSYFGADKNLDAYGKTTDLTLVGGGQYTRIFDELFFMPAELTTGVEYTDGRLKDEMLGYDRIIDQRSTTYGAFVQNEWKNEKAGISVGGRLDKHNMIDKAIFNPRMNARYTPSELVAFRLNYSSGYRAPQVYDEDLHVAAVGEGEVVLISNAPGLRPEYSNSLSGSVDLYGTIGGVEANLLIEGFYTDIKDVFVLEPNGEDSDGNKLRERRNSEGAIVKGVNFDLKVGFTSKLILDAGFTMQKSTYKEALVWSDGVGKEPSLRMLRTPDNYGYFTLNYKPVSKLSLSLTGNYTGSMIVPGYRSDVDQDWMRTTRSFLDMGFKVAYDIKLSSQTKMNVSVGVKNIFDQYQPDLEVGGGKDAGYIYGPAMPRVFHVGVKFNI